MTDRERAEANELELARDDAVRLFMEPTVDSVANALLAYKATGRREALEEAVKWRPIETAPKDGTRILLAKIVGHPDHDTALWWACLGHWSSKWNNWNDGIEPCGLAGPTHWLPANGHGIPLATPAGGKEG